MSDRERLESKGYDINTKDLGISWLCTLEWHSQIQNFYGCTEAESIKQATRFVADLERNYERQQQLMRCEGCGDFQ